MTQLVMVPAKAAREKTFGEAPVGTGPYKFARWNRGREISLTIHDGYWGKKPSITEFIVRVIPDPQTQIAALQTGEIDLVLDLVAGNRRNSPPGSSPFRRQNSATFNSTRIRRKWQTQVRLALNLAVDKKPSPRPSTWDMDAPWTAASRQGNVGLKPKLKPFPYDPKRARQLLKEAGYPDGSNWSFMRHRQISQGRETSEVVAAQLRKSA